MSDLWIADFRWGTAQAPDIVPPGGDTRLARSVDGQLGRMIRSASPVAAADPALEWQSMTCLLDVAGASARQPATYYYVVETDVVAEHEDDFNAWYEQEHLPGLAAVPGTVSARRYRREQAGPRYYACYELADRTAFGSPPWLAVRGTRWSDRVRPHFRNTVRTMYQYVAPHP
ncbi:hypothetical protein BH10PSE17_BH10PSE17_14530 [soil metagenome]